jgi:S-adenosylmethionine synthetase
MKSAEWVSPKHPDKMADQISDAVLDYCLKQDPLARVAVEVFGCHGKVIVGGEITFNGEIKRDDVFSIVERITGKKDLEEIEIRIVKQSLEIARGVDADGAGDQGIMVGYACNDNERMVPQEKYLADSLGEYLYERHPYDGKTEVVLEENEDGYQITTIVASFQLVSSDILREDINKWLSLGIFPTQCNILCNPAGFWAQGGFDADTGLTGRKLMVDNYGPQIPVGGGAFSGKDATKVDRSGAYMARKIAVDFKKKKEYENEKDVTVKLAYAIGVADPVMATVEIRGESIDMSGHDRIIKIDLLKENLYDLTPKGIIELLKLREPIYEETARGGHFGKGFIWDK